MPEKPDINKLKEKLKAKKERKAEIDAELSSLPQEGKPELKTSGSTPPAERLMYLKRLDKSNPKVQEAIREVEKELAKSEGEERVFPKEDVLKNLRETIERVQSKMRNRERAIEENQKLVARLQAELAELDAEEKKTENEEVGVKFYSKEFIEKKIGSLFKTVKGVELRLIQVADYMMSKDKLELYIAVTAGGMDISVDSTIGNTHNGVAVLSYNITANFIAKRVAESKIKPYLSEISEKLKEFIEKEENKKVKSLVIENGQLKVAFV